MKRALFLDRDGVINVDSGYIGTTDEFEIIPAVIDLLRTARKQDFLIIVITNQSGIARGYFTSDDYNLLEAHMRKCLGEYGVTLDGIYHCPHHPEGAVPEFAIECSCRKPAPGLILRAAREHDVDLSRSILVGDKQSDLAAASAAGLGRAFLVKDADHYADAFSEVIEALKSS